MQAMYGKPGSIRGHFQTKNLRHYDVTGFCRIFATQPKFEKQKAYCVPYMEVNVCTAGAIVM